MVKKNDKTAGAITQEVAKIFLDRAHAMYEDEGTLEIDRDIDDPIEQVSIAGETVEGLKVAGGLYVKAWVWVSVNDLSEEEYNKVFGAGTKE